MSGESQGCENTDRELWRGPDEGNGSYYANSLHITKEGALGINCGGHVVVMPIREWHRLGAIGRSPEPWDAPYNRSYEPVERRAAEIYATYEFEPPHLKPAWHTGGNSLRQDMARSRAREELREAGHGL